MKDHRDVAERFVRAYMRACRDIAASNGKWTPEMIDSETKWSGLDRSAIADIPGPAYPGIGKINVDAVRRQQELWLGIGMMTKRVPIAPLIDESFANTARKSLGMK